LLTRNDVLILLKELKDNGVDTSSVIMYAVREEIPSIKVLKFINEYRPLDIQLFYEKLRKSYNDKRSKLYINIVREIEDPNEVLTTLSSLVTQILLFSRTVEDPQMFLKTARLDDITKCLYAYTKTYDILPSIKLLQYIKADLKAFESLKNTEEESK
jgi:hypothetical protein